MPAFAYERTNTSMPPCGVSERACEKAGVLTELGAVNSTISRPKSGRKKAAAVKAAHESAYRATWARANKDVLTYGEVLVVSR